MGLKVWDGGTEPVGRTARWYRLFGLVVCSEIALPEVQEISAAESGDLEGADLVIELGEAPSTIQGARAFSDWALASDRACLLKFEGIGSFFVEDGRRIVVEKSPDASFDDLRGFLLGSGVGAALHMRGAVPLHVSAVATPIGAVAFTGESGAGKSTAAAYLNQHYGWPIICDDVAVLEISGDVCSLRSGINSVKLWSDALAFLKRGTEGLRRDLARFEKFHAIDAERFASGTFPLTRLVRLRWNSPPGQITATGREAFKIAIEAVYRPEFASLFSNNVRVGSASAKLAACTRIDTLNRPRDHQHLGPALETLISAS